MSRFYPDVPEYLRISDQPVRVGMCKGNQLHHAHRMDWTPALEELAHRMHEDGETWRAIAEELADRTGIRISDNACSDFIERCYGEK